MKDLSLLIWITQLGISVAGPLAGFPLLAVWLRDSLGLGSWVVWVGAIAGVCSAVGGLRDALRYMDRYIKRKKTGSDDAPPVYFNDHI